jgi:hypothetical protein
MIVEVDDENWPIGLVRAKLETRIKDRLAAGWAFKSHSVTLLPSSSSLARVFMVFEKAEA